MSENINDPLWLKAMQKGTYAVVTIYFIWWFWWLFNLLYRLFGGD